LILLRQSDLVSQQHQLNQLDPERPLHH
jgi:hypothetical protein